MGAKCFWVFLVFCLLGVEGQSFHERNLVRNVRQRGSVNKRPQGLIGNEESLITVNTKRPIINPYINGGNNWKPLYNIPTRPVLPSVKYRTKPNLYSAKYQQSNIIYPADYYQKQSQQPTNFIANQSLLVADIPDVTNLKIKKTKHQYIPKKSNSQQYEVHEEVEDDSPSYSTQNQYHYHEGSVTRGNKGTVKPSTQFNEMIGQERHVHHVHYHDTIEEAKKASLVAKPTYLRNFRGSTTSRRPY